MLCSTQTLGWFNIHCLMHMWMEESADANTDTKASLMPHFSMLFTKTRSYVLDRNISA
ncbi:hypothetical protein EXN66_Car021306 [Channa argus]|uniref:Uncharacterized protein n=1 Tax=Channa argus TaxID=215402 RepID=A0A6G1QST6_CHAAH|nr:hypothetical protein EXN66_Car021306 [Channa argus]